MYSSHSFHRKVPFHSYKSRTILDFSEKWVGVDLGKAESDTQPGLIITPKKQLYVLFMQKIMSSSLVVILKFFLKKEWIWLIIINPIEIIISSQDHH